MAEILSTELKSDLEYVYKITGDLLNQLEDRDFSKESNETKQILDSLKFQLESIGGTLQKDIHNCDYLLTKINAHKSYN